MAIGSTRRTRREMLASMATLAGGALLSPESFSGSGTAATSGYHPLLSAQTYIWFQQFQSQNKTLGEGVEEALAGLRRAGFRRAEMMSDFLKGEMRAKTLSLLAKYELKPATVYAGGTLHEEKAAEDSIARILELAKALKGAGTRAIVNNPNPKPGPERKSDEELKTQARYVNQLGRELQKLGMRFLLHHHTPELVEDAREWKHLLANTDPGSVFCCVDVDWAVRGGQNPMKFLREVGARLGSLHVRNSKQGVWMEEFGEGDHNYLEVADYLKQLNYDGYVVVELAYEKNTKITRSLEENLRLSRLYAEKVFGLERS